MDYHEILQDPILKMDILMWRVIKQFIKTKKQILEKSGLTCSQFDLLSAIQYYSAVKKEIIQIDLSQKTDIDPMTTSTILRNLERKGLVMRQRSTVNTRTILVQLTDRGINLLQQATSEIREAGKNIYQDIDKEWMIGQLLKLYDKLNN